MRDYSLHHVATRPAKVEDKLVGECTPSTCSVFNHGPCIPEFYVRSKRTTGDFGGWFMGPPPLM